MEIWFRLLEQTLTPDGEATGPLFPVHCQKQWKCLCSQISPLYYCSSTKEKYTQHISINEHSSLAPILWLPHCNNIPRWTVLMRLLNHPVTSHSVKCYFWCNYTSSCHSKQEVNNLNTVNVISSCDAQSWKTWTHRCSQYDEQVCTGMTRRLLPVKLLPELPKHLRASQKLWAHLLTHLLLVSPYCDHLFPCGCVTLSKFSAVILALQTTSPTLCCHLLLKSRSYLYIFKIH